MWESIARLVLRFRLYWLIALLSATTFMAWRASRVQLSYDFNTAIPTDNPKYKAYQDFRQKFGEDGNVLVIGVQSDKLFQQDVFNDFAALTKDLRGVQGVDDVLGVATAINLVKDTATQKLKAVPIFPAGPASQAAIDSGKAVLLGLPFYQGLLYNAKTNAWLTIVHVNKHVMNSSDRLFTVGQIRRLANAFATRHGLDIHLSGLPLIRTVMADKVATETKWFLLGSI